MDIVRDHRQPWTGGPNLSKKSARDKVHDLVEKAPVLLKKYLAMHGDWQEVTSHVAAETAYSSSQSWQFTVCQCEVCQAAEKLVGHPETPNG